jgi:hypothetical protein
MDSASGVGEMVLTLPEELVPAQEGASYSFHICDHHLFTARSHSDLVGLHYLGEFLHLGPGPHVLAIRLAGAREEQVKLYPFEISAQRPLYAAAAVRCHVEPSTVGPPTGEALAGSGAGEPVVSFDRAAVDVTLAEPEPVYWSSGCSTKG